MLRLGSKAEQPNRNYPKDDVAGTPEFKIGKMKPKYGEKDRPEAQFEIPAQSFKNEASYRRRRFQAEGGIVAVGFVGFITLAIGAYLFYVLTQDEGEGSGDEEVTING